MPSPSKEQLVALILEKLRESFESRQSAARQTRAVGNDAESKSEGKYDTRSIEENYLADGLARQAHCAVADADALEKLPLHDFAPDEAIDLGALVELDFGDGGEWFFLSPGGGGIEVGHGGRTVTVITPESPLGARILDQHAGERVDGTQIRTVS